MEPSTLGALIDRLAATLELYARPWCDAPEDVVQEAFVKLAAQRPSPRDPAAWLFRAVKNGAVNAGIARQRRRRHEAEAAARLPPWFEPETGQGGDSPGLDPGSARDALAALPGPQREAIVAHLWGGLTFEEVAGLVGTSASSAHRLYHSGLKALRERLGVPCPGKTSRTIPN